MLGPFDNLGRMHHLRRQRCEIRSSGRSVFVHSFSDIDDSVVMDYCNIGRHARIRRAIIDKNVHIPEGEVIGYDLEQDRKRFSVTDSGIVVIPKAPKARWNLPLSRERRRSVEGPRERTIMHEMSESHAPTSRPPRHDASGRGRRDCAARRRPRCGRERRRPPRKSQLQLGFKDRVLFYLMAGVVHTLSLIPDFLLYPIGIASGLHRLLASTGGTSRSG